MIDKFNGPYRFLSNFWPCNVTLDGVKYTSTEHAYQAAKTVNPAEREMVRIQSTSGKAKKAGKRVTLRADWDDVRVEIMRDLVMQKFEQQPLKQLLLATENEELVEGNHWGDTFWGVCNGIGENRLGKILMGVRQMIKDGKL